MSSIMREDWIECELGGIFNVVSGNTPAELKSTSKNGVIPFFKVSDMNHLGNEVFMKQSNILLNDSEVLKLKIKLYPKETVIFPKRGGAILTNKKRILVSEASFDLNIMGVIPNNYILGFYTYFWFIKLDLSKIYDGSNVPQINNKNILPLPFPLAPLPIQRAIVSKIEALFSDLDNGIANFKKAQEQLKVYRQAVLKKAFEGGFSSITNEGNQDNHTNQKNHSSDNLPKGWKWVKLKDLGAWRGGGTPSKQVTKYWENGTNLWVTSKDMKFNVILDSIDKITDEAITNSSANRIHKGAVLFVMRSGILRHTFPVAIAGRDLTVNQDLQSLSPNGLATSEFIFWFIKAFNYEIRHKCSKDGTTVESIDSNALKDYPFILPSLPEQHQIVQEIESRLSVCDKMEQSLNESIEKAEALRQSILKKAFEGKLLSQAEIEQCKKEADYEPASELLKKIQAEKLAKEQEKKKPSIKKKSKQ